jgi:hypothetical protein
MKTAQNRLLGCKSPLVGSSNTPNPFYEEGNNGQTNGKKTNKGSNGLCPRQPQPKIVIICHLEYLFHVVQTPSEKKEG